VSDPLKDAPDVAVALFEKLGQLAHGFGFEAVVNAGFNLNVNAFRQFYPTRAQAERAWDEVVAKAKGNLMDCYDSTGRKKGIYPYHQIIRVPLIDLREK
jgi:hypothetical protein